MFTSAAPLRRPASARVFALFSLLALVAAAGVGVSGPVELPPLPVPEAVVSGVPDAVVGGVPYPATRLGCLGCASVLLVAGGGTVLGVTALATAVPHYFGWCAFGCYLAYR